MTYLGEQGWTFFICCNISISVCLTHLKRNWLVEVRCDLLWTTTLAYRKKIRQFCCLHLYVQHFRAKYENIKNGTTWIHSSYFSTCFRNISNYSFFFIHVILFFLNCSAYKYLVILKWPNVGEKCDKIELLCSS